MKAKGKCLCQAVRFSFELKEKTFDACHCSMCRTWGGGPVLTVESAGGIEFHGEENIEVYPSSSWAERGFCRKCGTHLFYRLKSQDFCNFNLGLIENHESFRFATQIFVDAQPANYSFANETKKMTEKEVIEAFGGQV